MKNRFFLLLILTATMLPSFADKPIFTAKYCFTGKSTNGNGWCDLFKLVKNHQSIKGYTYSTWWEFSNPITVTVYNDSIVMRAPGLNYNMVFHYIGDVGINGKRIGVGAQQDTDFFGHRACVNVHPNTKSMIYALLRKEGMVQLLELKRVDGTDGGILSSRNIPGYYSKSPFGDPPTNVNTFNYNFTVPYTPGPSTTTPSVPTQKVQRHCTTCYGTGVCQTCGGDGIATNPYYPSLEYECPNCKSGHPRSDWGHCQICHGSGKLGY